MQIIRPALGVRNWRLPQLEYILRYLRLFLVSRNISKLSTKTVIAMTVEVGLDRTLKTRLITPTSTALSRYASVGPHSELCHPTIRATLPLLSLFLILLYAQLTQFLQIANLRHLNIPTTRIRLTSSPSPSTIILSSSLIYALSFDPPG